MTLRYEQYFRNNINWRERGLKKKMPHAKEIFLSNISPGSYIPEKSGLMRFVIFHISVYLMCERRVSGLKHPDTRDSIEFLSH